MDEWDKYRHDQARAWLEHVAKLKHAVDAASDMADMFRGLAEGARAIDYTRERVRGGEYRDRMAEAIASLDEAEAQWAANLVAFTDESRDAADRIARLPDATESQALLLHYVDGVTWERVCVRMNYSWDGMMALRRRAVTAMYDHMPTEWRDPMPSAT